MNNIHDQLCHRGKEPEEGVLYVVGTPIGNLNDISERARRILNNVSFVACEDTRVTSKLLNSFKIKNKLFSFYKNNSYFKSPYIISELKKGNSVALVSDAGLPLISDPGESLVREAKESNIDVICIPGPCAALTALVSSGLMNSGFIFYGFIPKKTNERSKILQEINDNKFASIIYESPKRLEKLLNDLKKISEGDRKVFLAKELTKKHEQHLGGTLDYVIENLRNIQTRGEFTLIISGRVKENNKNAYDYDSIRIDLLNLIQAGLSHSSAANYLSKKLKKPKNKIYGLIHKK